MVSEHVVIVGAGVGGLSAAIALAAKGVAVTVLERAGKPGGKLREVPVGGAMIDGGPTVFTMRWVFEELLAEAGLSLADEIPLVPSQLLARHAWSQDETLDLFVDVNRSQDAVAAFAGPDEGRRFRDFVTRAAEVYRTLEGPFLRSSRPGMISLTTRIGLGRLPDMLRLQPFSSLWSALGRHFRDPRLQQLYGRYATYCGSSPFLCPATLMLVAHVEQDGVWFVQGGMARLADNLARIAAGLGVTIRCHSAAGEVVASGSRVTGVKLASGEMLPADAVIVNADASAVGAGLLGPAIAGATRPVAPDDRSLSAFAWTAVARSTGFPLTRHGVFFSSDYRREFDQIQRGRAMPDDPTVYVCAQDRGDEPLAGPERPERFLILVNAPAVGDLRTFDRTERERCTDQMLGRLKACGLTLTLDPEATTLTTPNEFATLFPGTGGAIYGRASHGWRASFLRPDSRTAIPGLFLAGGSVHPGPGVPMAALSGRLAAREVLSDFASTGRFRPVATPGGMSTRSATTGATA
ncbi:1-hydroxycarotenoid 3,4-desaturase CrtD [uncultured Alsobacter sp.]|uniref:1-hydroxycarotenoid 3,4-desaturase CrtD n=1 Tax=uncultured Alsobacter sp. TaxID=1748258 RepID=UPI0025CBE1BF|nr:1-hydroxycarotenoid 3,4-desaturase CrtD [uncultured Alsobacter sp.]